MGCASLAARHLVSWTIPASPNEMGNPRARPPVVAQYSMLYETYVLLRNVVAGENDLTCKVVELRACDHYDGRAIVVCPIYPSLRRASATTVRIQEKKRGVSRARNCPAEHRIIARVGRQPWQNLPRFQCRRWPQVCPDLRDRRPTRVNRTDLN